MHSFNNGAVEQTKNGLTLTERANLWRELRTHLIGLATVFWVMVFKERPPKC